MASLTTDQQTSILSYMGYAQFGSAGAIKIQFTQLRDYLQNADFTIEYINNLNTVLVSLAAIDTKIDGIVQLINIKKADVIEFNADQGLGTLYQMGSVLVERLSGIVGFPVLINPYSQGSKPSYLGGY